MPPGLPQGPLVENFSLSLSLLYLAPAPNPNTFTLPFLPRFTHHSSLALSLSSLSLSFLLPLPFFHRSTPSSFSLSRSSRSYVYEWDSFEPRFTNTHTISRVTRALPLSLSLSLWCVHLQSEIRILVQSDAHRLLQSVSTCTPRHKT